MGYWLANLSRAQVRSNLPNSFLHNVTPPSAVKIIFLQLIFFDKKLASPLLREQQVQVFQQQMHNTARMLLGHRQSIKMVMGVRDSHKREQRSCNTKLLVREKTKHTAMCNLVGFFLWAVLLEGSEMTVRKVRKYKTNRDKQDIPTLLIEKKKGIQERLMLIGYER